jgi:plasmid stabilization system protein ParE
MNPPFAEGERHLLKALDMQSTGGKIVCILNAETIKNPSSVLRKDLITKLERLGAAVEYIENAFSDAERRTDVEIALVYVDIPANGESILLDHLKKATEQEPTGLESKKLISSDFIQGLLQQYNHLARIGSVFICEYREIKEALPADCKDFLKLSIDDKSGYYNQDFAKEALNDYVRKLRHVFWEKLFENKEWRDRLTSNLLSELYGKLNDLCEYEFSEWNIMRLWLEVMSSLSEAMEKTIVNLFESFSHDYHYTDYSDNIHYYNGWRTNKCWKVNHKIILPLYAFDHWSCDKSYRLRYYNVSGKLGDIEKVFDVLNTETSDFPDIGTVLNHAERCGATRNVETRYFVITFYKKGTAHITFKNLELLKKFNIFASQRKNWLPPTYGKKHYSEMSQEEQSVVDGFEGAVSYEAVIRNKGFYLVENKQSLLMLDCAS